MQDSWSTPKRKGNFMPTHSTPKSSLDETAAQVAATNSSQSKMADAAAAVAPRAVQFASTSTSTPKTSRKFLATLTTKTKRDPVSSTDDKDRRSPHRLCSKLNHTSREPGPEELAAMMHRHQSGLNMSSAPTTMLQFLFPHTANSGVFLQDTDQLCELSCFGPGPWVDNAIFTTVVMRGTSNPPNFPGFLVSLPNTDGKIALAPSPSTVLTKAHAALHSPSTSTILIS